MPLQASLKAEEGTRTLDLRITNATRYQLRYFGLDCYSFPETQSFAIISPFVLFFKPFFHFFIELLMYRKKTWIFPENPLDFFLFHDIIRIALFNIIKLKIYCYFYSREQ